MTINSTALGTFGPLSRGSAAAPRVRMRPLNYCLAVLLAACLLAASTHKTWGQLGWWCGSDDEICTNTIFGTQWCEPITTAAARAMCPLPQQEEQGPPPQQEEQVPAPQQREPGSARAEPPKLNWQQIPGFNPNTQSQIPPLNCPRGFARTGSTFYGGTMCSPVVRPSLAAGEQLPWEWPTQPKSPVREPRSEGPPAAQDNESIEPTPAPTDQSGNSPADIERAKSNWEAINAWFQQAAAAGKLSTKVPPVAHDPLPSREAVEIVGLAGANALVWGALIAAW